MKTFCQTESQSKHLIEEVKSTQILRFRIEHLKLACLNKDFNKDDEVQSFEIFFALNSTFSASTRCVDKNYEEMLSLFFSVQTLCEDLS